MNKFVKNIICITTILSGIFALILICSFIAYASNFTNLNETVDSTENATNINSNYTIYENISGKYNSQFTDDNTNFTINIFTKNAESNINIFNIKMNILNQIIQLIIFILTIIMAVNIATYQILEPKFHPLFKALMFKRTIFIVLASVLLVNFGILTYNFVNIPSNTMLNIELTVLFLSTISLIILFYKLIRYSNKSSLIVAYLNSLNNYDIFAEVCNKFGYPNEEKKSEISLILKSVFLNDAKDNNPSVGKENLKLDNEQIKLLNKKIKEHKNESDIESIFDIMASMIEKSEYKFFHKHINKIHEILFPILKDKSLNSTMRENIVYFLIINYDKLIKISIDKEDFEYYVFLIEAYEKLGEILIDVEDFKSVKIVVDQIGKYSFDINRKIFHIDYSYKPSDSIFKLINYYIDTETYNEQIVQKWLEIIGAIAEDIVNVDYQIKYRSIRNDYTSKTKSEYNPVNQIINDLELLNKKVIKRITPANDVKNGQYVIEITSSILKQITMELLELNDYSTTYNIYSAYKKITQNSINNEIHYALNYIIQDLHKIGNELIIKKWYNNANALLFDIAEFGVFAENKNLINLYNSNEYWFHNFAEILKYLFEKFVDVFGNEPHQKDPDDFFMELTITSESQKFEDYYNSCKPKEIILEDIKEQP